LGAGKKTPEGSFESGSFNIVHQPKNPEIAVVTLGPVTNNALAALEENEELKNLVTVIAAKTFPLELTTPVKDILRASSHILVAEEHVSIGGLAQQLSVQLLEQGIAPSSFVSLRAEGYPNKKYGSQQYHQKLSRLDSQSIKESLLNLLQ
jgi:transketolase